MAYIGNKPTNIPLSSSDLPDNIVTSAKIADDAVDSDQLASGAVDDAHLATGISSSKLTGALPAISGASLTNLDARDLENALPAIDGSSLTGVGVTGITSSANATAITISADEEVTMPLQPYYLAWGGAQANVTGAGTTVNVTFTGRIDTGSNVSSNTFTAPITGKYLICTSVHIENITSNATAVGHNIITSNRTYGSFEADMGGDLHEYYSIRNAVVADMDAADTAYLQCRVADMSGDTADLGSGSGYHYWSVTLLT